MGRLKLWAFLFLYNAKNLTHGRAKPISLWAINFNYHNDHNYRRNNDFKNDFWGSERNWIGLQYKNVSSLTLKKSYNWCLISFTLLDTMNILKLFLEPFMASWLQKYFFLYFTFCPIIREWWWLVNNPRGHISQPIKFALLKKLALSTQQKSKYSQQYCTTRW